MQDIDQALLRTPLDDQVFILANNVFISICIFEEIADAVIAFGIVIFEEFWRLF
jgi:hypothetical protein